MPTVYDSGWRKKNGFRVRTVIESGPPTELRRAWYQRMLAKGAPGNDGAKAGNEASENTPEPPETESRSDDAQREAAA